MKEIICIVCPKGCRLQAEADGSKVTGYGCPRGEAYGRAEATHPTRVLTTTVRLTEGAHRRLPVKTSLPIPKEMLFEAMKRLEEAEAVPPVRCGEVIVANLFNTGADVVATRSVE